MMSSRCLLCLFSVVRVMLKNMENIIICRILFCVMVFIIDLGIRWLKNFLIVNLLVVRFVLVVFGDGSVMLVFGCSRLVMIMFSVSDISDVMKN